MSHTQSGSATGRNTNGGTRPSVPRELAVLPTVVPPTTSGGLGVGVLEDMPNGGGTRVYLITVDGPGAEEVFDRHGDEWKLDRFRSAHCCAQLYWRLPCSSL
jgi:hypothetical protein